ncbi:MAG: SGNH/GDSL hydrolase family protein [Burkholderiales bacterium]|nr:SGNH/GDSL hydrolase family protein [Burkholderiales bacterium]
MKDIALALAFAPVAPLMLWQGRRVRRVTPVLPAAAGPQSGSIGGAHGAQLKLLVFGESTAAGVGARHHEEALAGHLASAISGRTSGKVDWSVCALSGATVKTAHESLLANVPNSPHDLIVLVFGVNDTLEHTRPARFAARMTDLIADLRARVGKAPVLLAAPPPMERFPALPHPLAAYLGARAALLRRALGALSLPAVAQVEVRIPITPDLFARDLFHPSARGYSVWAEALATAAFAHHPLLARP